VNLFAHDFGLIKLQGQAISLAGTLFLATGKMGRGDTSKRMMSTLVG
jgi:hypothetical protein